MKRTNSTLAIIAGLMMTLFGSVAYANCSTASGYSSHDMNSNMSKPVTIDRTSWYDDLAN
jgi:hypothetical protein